MASTSFFLKNSGRQTWCLMSRPPRVTDADLDALPACPAEHSAGGAAKQVVEQRPIVIEERPQQVRYGEGDILPVAVGQDVLLFGNPLLDSLEATVAAGLDLQLWQAWGQSGEAQQ
jgi:hypothetical protein